MSLIEILALVVMVVLALLGSRGLGHMLGMPDALAVIPITAFLFIVLRVFAKIPTRRSLALLSFLVVITLLAMWLGRDLGSGLRGLILAPVVATIVVLLVIQTGAWIRRRIEVPKGSK
jgi:hypothetical protein